MYTDFQAYFAASRRAGTLPGPLVDFDLVDRLGKGSFSEVWSIRQRGSNRTFALKTINKRQTKVQGSEFHVYMERLVLQQQFGPETPRLYAIFKDDSYLYFQTQLAEGGTLAKYLKKKGASLNAPQRRQLVEKIVALLFKFHSKGVVHGDLKPENILLDAHLSPLLCDFGCARVLPSASGANDSLYEEFTQIQAKYAEKVSVFKMASSSDSLTSDDEPLDQMNRYIRLGSLTGTVDYLSPEVIQGRPAEFASDFWALGVIIHQIFTSKYLFRKDCELQTVEAIESGETDIDPSLPRFVQDLIQALTTVDRRQRLGSRGSTISENYDEIWDHPFFDADNWDEKTDENSWLTDSKEPFLSHSIASQGRLNSPLETKAVTSKWLLFSEAVRLKVDGTSLTVVRENDLQILQRFALDSALVVRHNAGSELLIERRGARFACTLAEENSVDWVRRVQEYLVK